MKQIALFVLSHFCIFSLYAIGPNELTFDGTKYIKNNEKNNKTSLSAEYKSNNNPTKSIVITHVLDKNDPNQIVKSLKQKTSVSVVEVENLKDADLLVSFVKFDLPNLKVQNNLCRIKKQPNLPGSIVFQYIDTTKLKNQSEGTTFPVFTEISEKIKQLPIDKYLTTLSQTKPSGYYSVPWFKRPNARTGIYYHPQDREFIREHSYPLHYTHY